MRKKIILKYVTLFLTLLIYTVVGAQSQTKKVLFLGNSYTYVNNLPQMIADIATSMGDTLIYDSYTIGGYTLDQHFADTNSTNKIKAGGWDYVVLQDQSQVPAFPDYSGFGAIYLSHLIKMYNPCARTLFYMTWGRQNGDAMNCAVWPPVCTYEGMDSLLYRSYMELAAGNHAEVSPVGAVWKYIRQNYPGINLYQPDESHPSIAGSYVAACCFYTSLFKKNPALITYNYVLTSPEADSIKNAAKTIQYDSLSNWYFEEDMPEANFHYMIGTGVNYVNFINESVNAESYYWDFGDGDTSTAENPVHHYLNDGSYVVKLISSSCDLSQIQQDVHQVNINFCAFTPTIFPDTLFLCPNESDTLWTQPYSSYQWFDANGDSLQNELNQYLFPAFGGYYNVLATQNGCSEMSAPAIVNTYNSLQFFYVNVTGNIIPPDTACLGDTLQLILTVNKPPYPDENNLQWFNNGVALPGPGNDTLVVTATGNYHVNYTDQTYCVGSLIYSSSPLTVNFKNCNLQTTEENNSQVIVYPNPSDNFIVKINSGLIGTDYSIIDVVGRNVQGGKFEKEFNTLKMSELNSGMYMLRIKNAAGQTIKLIRK